MLSKRFMTWIGVGVLSVATIPTFAAPHLARLAARKPVAKTATAQKAPAKKAAPAKLAAKPAAKPAALAKVPVAEKKTPLHATAKPHKLATTKKPAAKAASRKALAAGQHHPAQLASKKNLH